MNMKKVENLHDFIITGLFYGLIGLLLWPLVRFNFIVTHDGPAHLYNACLIRELISGNNLVAEFLTLKKFPEPNWIGHFLLADLSAIFSPRIAEKIFLAAYLFFERRYELQIRIQVFPF
jgi:hypothetical protein